MDLEPWKYLSLPLINLSGRRLLRGRGRQRIAKEIYAG